jgi:hypothetical protein
MGETTLITWAINTIETWANDGDVERAPAYEEVLELLYALRNSGTGPKPRYLEGY